MLYDPACPERRLFLSDLPGRGHVTPAGGRDASPDWVVKLIAPALAIGVNLLGLLGLLLLQ